MTEQIDHLNSNRWKYSSNVDYTGLEIDLEEYESESAVVGPGH